jgi:hypothetical protein
LNVSDSVVERLKVYFTASEASHGGLLAVQVVLREFTLLYFWRAY